MGAEAKSKSGSFFGPPVFQVFDTKFNAALPFVAETQHDPTEGTGWASHDSEPPTREPAQLGLKVAFLAGECRSTRLVGNRFH